MQTKTGWCKSMCHAASFCWLESGRNRISDRPRAQLVITAQSRNSRLAGAEDEDQRHFVLWIYWNYTPTTMVSFVKELFRPPGRWRGLRQYIWIYDGYVNRPGIDIMQCVMINLAYKARFSHRRSSTFGWQMQNREIVCLGNDILCQFNRNTFTENWIIIVIG